MATSDGNKLHTPRSRVCIVFNVNTPKGRDMLLRAFGLDGEPIKVAKRDDIRVKNAARRAEVEKQAAAEGADPQLAHDRPGMLGDTGVKAIDNLHGVMLDEVITDLLVRGFVVTGAQCKQESQVNRKTGRFTDTNKLKWKIRVWFTDPSELDPDPKGEGLHSNEALAESLTHFLNDTVCGIVHVWENPDNSANIEAIAMGPAPTDEKLMVRKLRFGRSHNQLAFYHEEAELNPGAA